MTCERTEEVLALIDEGRLTEAAHLAEHPNACDVCVRAITDAVLSRAGHGAAPAEDEVALLAVGLADAGERMAAELALGDEADEVLAAAPVPEVPVAPPTFDLLPPPPAKLRWPWLAGAGAATVAAAILFLVAPSADVAPPAAISRAPEPAATRSGPGPEKPVAEAPAPEVPDPAPPPAAEPPAPEPAAEKPAAVVASPKPRPRARRASRPKAKPKRRRGGDEVDDLLGALDGNGGGSRRARAAPPAGAAPALPASLSRSQILKVVKRSSGRVRECGRRDPSLVGTIAVKLRIARSGLVTSAEVVTGKFKGTPVGKCVSGVVGKLRFPQFAGRPMRITLPFGL